MLVALQLAWGCAPELEVTEVALELRVPSGCELGAAESLELRALGDFPARRERFDLRARRTTFDGVPIGTRELVIEGQFAAGALASGRASVVATQGGEPAPIVLLPESRSCPLGDPAAVARAGVAAAPLPGGGFLIAGGGDASGQILSRAWVLRAGRVLLDEVPDGMLLRRRDASATRVGGAVLVAGGASDASGEADQTFEVYDPVRGAFARELSRKLSAGSRMEHGAALLADGRVLLAGGRSEPAGAPLATAQLIRLEPPEQEQPSDLNTARIAPEVLVLDSGAVLVVGGRDEHGAVVTRVERFEAAAARFVTLDVDLPAYEDVAVAALPGARLAWVGCDTRARIACGFVIVLVRGEEPIAIDVALPWPERVPRGLVSLRAITLEDGRVLVTGREPDASMASRAFVLDPSERTLEPDEASRAPTVVLRLDDGVVAELDPAGASLRRLGSFSVYDTPPAELVAVERLRVALDAPERWERSSRGLRALVRGARLDVPRLRFGAMRVELELSGSLQLRLSAADAPELTLHIGGAEPAADGCGPVPAGARVFLERRGELVRVWSERPASSCSVRWRARGLAALALEAEADAVLRSLRVRRL